MASQTKSQARIGQIVKALETSKAPPDNIALARHLWQHALPEDTACFTNRQLIELTAKTYDLVCNRKPGRAKVNIYNYQSGGKDSAGMTVIDIINDDMPFLFDSTVHLLTGTGHEIDLVTHPVIPVMRRTDGALREISLQGHDGDDYIRESLMHFHISVITSRDARQALADEISAMLDDVRAAVLDWRVMQDRIARVVDAYQQNPPPVPVDELTESTAFLNWLLDDHFTLLGVREYKFSGGVDDGTLKPLSRTGLGVLRNPKAKVLTGGSSNDAITDEIRAYLRQPSPLIITKSDCISRVHRRTEYDYIGVKLFNARGDLTGELRIIGLFTSTAYTRSPRTIPLVRKKISGVIAIAGLNPQSHSGKGMLNILETFPRDELFQIEINTLHEMVLAIIRLEERPRTRLLVRTDRFDRFVSAFVFIPRDRFNSSIRSRAGTILAQAFNGRVTKYSPFFSESPLVRVHFIITRNPGPPPGLDLSALEQAIIETVRTWPDRLGDVIRNNFDPAVQAGLLQKYQGAFSAAYEEAFTQASARYDIVQIEQLAGGTAIGVHFFDLLKEPPEVCRLKLYHYDEPISLSARLPIIENMGLKASEESTFKVTPHTGKKSRAVFIHEVVLYSQDGSPVDIKNLAEKLEQCFLAVWENRAENDPYNALVLKAGFDWRDASLLRACGRYLRQTGIAYSAGYMAATLVRYPVITRKLRDMFYIRFDISRKTAGGRVAPKPERRRMISDLAREISQDLRDVPSLDEDLIMRRYLNFIRATVRTNYFQTTKDGHPPATISFKIDSAEVEDLPAPAPYAEIFVYSPQVEGIHLRGGKIARGGLRWSDRPEDFRTEVLGLAKAQNVKNAVIVPVGAKGGFVPKNLPENGSREEVFAAGKKAYELFVSSLLDITDNLDGEKVIPPRGVFRNDGDDPYLVVAADKGTATFSDTANAISKAHGFWLDDAFASGGSAGYDHKKMGITAKGGWEAVKRHFREMDIDIQTTPFTVIGVGDMSGDVFGNGMLLSKQIRLLAAFDHRDIFIDPDPDPAVSFAERKRLFNLPRSSWDDYDRKLISKGGGVFSRKLKAIELTAQIRELTGLTGRTATPSKLINALLKARAGLLWFGGIGTYVKATDQAHADVGDRANDAVRVNASELNVKVIGEGANLGITHKARIEFAARGGRINTDAIDNSAGVNSSDVEVNFKIAFGAAESAGKLKRAQRNKLLAAMTDDVAALVLRNNYLQTLCLSMCEVRSSSEYGYTRRLMEAMERDGQLDRKMEDLPDGTELTERETAGIGFYRPEMAVLAAYAKIALYDELIAGTVPDDPYLESQLFRYFPELMAKKFRAEITGHKLRREIIATLLSNSIINRGGPTFVHRLMEETGHDAHDIARAFIVARDTFGFTRMNDMVDALDNKLSGKMQLKLYVELQRVLRRATVWYLLNSSFDDGLESLIDHYRNGLELLEIDFDKALPDAGRAQIKERQRKYLEDGVPDATAKLFSRLRYMQRGPDIVQVAAHTGQPVIAVASTFYEVGSGLAIAQLFQRAGNIAASDYYERLAINRTLDGIVQTHRAIVKEIMSSKKPADRNWQAWSQQNASAVVRVQRNMEDLHKSREFNLARLAVAASQLSDIISA